MAQTVRQNFILPKTTKKLLDELVPKGKQSAFAAKVLELQLKSKKSWKILEMPAVLDIKDPIEFARKIRKEWDRKL